MNLPSQQPATDFDLSRYRDVLNHRFVAYLENEVVATRLCHFHPQVIPGLLQTEAYTRTVSGAISLPTSAEKVELQVEARMARRPVLDRAETHFVIDEAVFSRGVDEQTPDQQLMRDQVDWLRQLARRPKVTIQVLPLQRSILRDLDGPFTVLDLPDPHSGGLVYLERSKEGGSAINRNTDEVDSYRDLFAQLVARSIDLERYLDCQRQHHR
jgi:hypothetical protein